VISGTLAPVAQERVRSTVPVQQIQADNVITIFTSCFVADQTRPSDPTQLDKEWPPHSRSAVCGLRSAESKESPADKDRLEGAMRESLSQAKPEARAVPDQTQTLQRPQNPPRPMQTATGAEQEQQHKQRRGRKRILCNYYWNISTSPPINHRSMFAMHASCSKVGRYLCAIRLLFAALVGLPIKVVLTFLCKCKRSPLARTSQCSPSHFTSLYPFLPSSFLLDPPQAQNVLASCPFQLVIKHRIKLFTAW
jgi:hypothetical protein